MYQSLYRRYRPQSFSDVVGQTVAVDVITRSLSSGRIGHAYLFSGPRGCGKTTVARLLAKAVNCTARNGAEPCGQCQSCLAIRDGRSLDVVEIDGASNNTVDEVRELKANVGLASFGGNWKVYIIDEVHMLSASAFNALLKTLEEPPERVMFILATTEPHKVPATIRSRCQHIPFHGLSVPDIVSQLKDVTAREGLSAESEALWEIARSSDGGMRDGLSLLEQVIALGGGSVTKAAVSQLTGGGSTEEIQSWLSLCRTDPARSVSVLSDMFLSGALPERLVSNVFSSVRNLWLLVRWGQAGLAGTAFSEDEEGWLLREGEAARGHSGSLESFLVRLAALTPQIRRGMGSSVVAGLVSMWAVDALSGKEPAVAEPPVMKPSIPANRVFSSPAPAAPAQDGGKTGVSSEREPSASRAPEPALTVDLPPRETENEPQNAQPFQEEAEQPASVEEKVNASSPVSLEEDPGRMAEAVDKLRKFPAAEDPVLWTVVHLASFAGGEGGVTVDLDGSQTIAWEAMNDRRMAALRGRLKAHFPDLENVTVRFCGQTRDCSGLTELEDAEKMISRMAGAKEEKADQEAESAEGSEPAKAGLQISPVEVEPVPAEPAGAAQEKKVGAQAESVLDMLAHLPPADLLYYRKETDNEHEETEP